MDKNVDDNFAKDIVINRPHHHRRVQGNTEQNVTDYIITSEDLQGKSSQKAISPIPPTAENEEMEFLQHMKYKPADDETYEDDEVRDLGKDNAFLEKDQTEGDKTTREPATMEGTNMDEAIDRVVSHFQHHH